MGLVTNGGGKRRDRKGSVPGRRTRRREENGSPEDEECAGRLRRSAGRLSGLNSRAVVDLLVEDALTGKMSAMRLLLTFAGRIGSADKEEKAGRSTEMDARR